MHRQGQDAPTLESGAKVSFATPLHRPAGGQFIAHAKALPGNPYDGHTLATVICTVHRHHFNGWARLWT